MPISTPSVTLSIIPAAQLAGVTDQKILVVGQIITGATATAATLYQSVQADGTEKTLFGARGHLAHLIQTVKQENKVTQVDAFTVADPTVSAAQAVYRIDCNAVVGDATEAGSIWVTFADPNKYRTEIAIVVGDTHATIAAKIQAAFATYTNAPFTTAITTGGDPEYIDITVTSNGAVGNDWPIYVEGVVDGVDVQVSATATAGAGTVVTSALESAIQNIRYQTIIWPSTYTTADIDSILSARLNVTNAVMDGVAITTKVDTLANLKSAALALNSEATVLIAQNPVDTASADVYPATGMMPDHISAQAGAIRALRLTQDAVLTPFLTSVARADQFGGIGIASLPYFNTALPNLPIANQSDDYSLIEYGELTDGGLAVVGPNRAYTGSVFGEFVTTYINDTAGNPDTSYKFLNTIDTVSVIREFFFENLKKRYAQTRLTDGDLIAGKDMANESSIRAFCNTLYDNLAREALVQIGTEAKQDYNQNLAVTVDVSSGTVTIDQAPLLVSQLRVVLGTIQVNFGGN